MTTSITYQQAVDEINGVFLAAWNSGAAAIAGYVPEIRWQNVEKATIPDASKFWVRHSIKSGGEVQPTLATNCGMDGGRRFRCFGVITVQVFCPKSLSTAAKVGRDLAILAKAAYRDAPEVAVTYANCYIKELAPEAEYYRFNVIAEFEYDEIA